MLTIDQIKIELLLNEQALRDALRDNNLTMLAELSMQRDNLKDMMIEALNTKLEAAQYD